MTCHHAYNHYTVNGQPACFDCWRAGRNARRAALRAELAHLLDCGTVMAETWLGDGRITDWRVNERWTATALAAHLENRYDAGWTDLRAYCLTCGTDTIPVPIATDDGDPRCENCDIDLMIHAAEVAMDGR